MCRVCVCVCACMCRVQEVQYYYYTIIFLRLFNTSSFLILQMQQSMVCPPLSVRYGTIKITTIHIMYYYY